MDGELMRRKCWFLLCLAAAALHAQIAFDNATDGGNNGGSSGSLSFNHQVMTSATPLLFVCLMGDNSPGGNDDITGVTYNSAALTLVQKFAASGSNNRFTYLYMLPNAATGTHSVAVSAAS